MKKNITINLSGRLYAIDEDAYELLSNYEAALHKYFCRHEGGEEIENDIKERVADLLDELKAQGVQAISIEHMQGIVARIGAPEQMGGEEMDGAAGADAGADAPEQQGRTKKRLYRDTRNKMVAGVLSGLSQYFGGDVTWWRLVIVGLCVVGLLSGQILPDWIARRNFIVFQLQWPVVVAYAILAIVMPKATSPEERLRMKGRDVNPQNLAEEVTEQAKEAEGKAAQPKSGGRELIDTLVHILVIMFKFVLLGFGVLLAVGVLVALFMLSVMLASPDIFAEMFDMEDTQFVPFLDAHLPTVLALAACIIVLLFVPAYCAIHTFLVTLRNIQPMGYVQRIVWLGVWLVAFVLACMTGTLVGKGVANHVAERNAEYVAAHTHEGFFFSDTDWDFFRHNGWKLAAAENCYGDRYTYSGQYATGDGDIRYLDAYTFSADTAPIKFQAERTDSVGPGLYRLTALARAQAEDEEADGVPSRAFVFLLANGDKHLAEIPASDDAGGSLWADAKALVSPEDTLLGGTPEQQRTKAIARANDREGFGWNRVCIDSVRIVAPTAATYGISTDPAFTGAVFRRSWFSATDFKLERIGD